jgi:hypothetical protein
VQLGDVEDRLHRGDFGVLNNAPDGVGQQFGQPSVHNGVGDAGGAHGLPGEFERKNAVFRGQVAAGCGH